MTLVAIRSLAARRLRTALTSIAVLLGVAMVAGTLIETDQITNAFERITKQSVSGIDVVVTPEESFTASFGAAPGDAGMRSSNGRSARWTGSPGARGADGVRADDRRR